ncbi:hypothetical protein V6N13_124350 [Hibiscus sabdariffa]
MTRSLPGNLVYEPEIEAFARRLRGETLRRRRQQASSLPDLGTSILQTEDLFEFENNREQTQMAEEDQTIRQLAVAPNVQHPLCITFPNGATPFQLKTGLIHLLPKFHGFPNENPHKYLTEFHLVCSSMKPQFFPAAKASELRRSILGIRQ